MIDGRQDDDIKEDEYQSSSDTKGKPRFSVKMKTSCSQNVSSGQGFTRGPRPRPRGISQANVVFE